MSLTDDSCCVSLFDFVPEGEQAAIRARTSTADATAWIQAAINHIDASGGGCLCLPAGTYQVNGTIQLKKRLTLEGAGQRGSILRHTGTGNCLESLWPINSSTAVDIRVRSLGIINTLGGNNTGSAIYEQGGTYVAFEDLLIENFKYGIILNQSELVDIDLCTIQAQSLASIWIVNGGDITPEASYSFTNRISVTRCQLNVAYNGNPNDPQGYCILDDGGTSHAFRDNNYNGSVTHIRAAGVTPLLISGGEFEGAGNVNLLLTYTRLSGAGVGGCGAVLLANCQMSPKYDRPAIEIHNCHHLSLVSCGFGNTQTSRPMITGMFNAYMVTELGTSNASVGPLFDNEGNP
ncbi:MAG TPA: glycosyl hydrolase family 28-related protein, partial [Allosphingosinicella sp.]